MKYPLLFITALFCCVTMFAQPKLYPGNTANGLDIFLLADPMSKYDSLLTCAGAPRMRGTVLTKRDSSCFVFRFLPAETDTIKIGSVRFPLVVLSSSFYGKLDNVLFIASYGETWAARGEEDYNNLVNYFNSIFKDPQPYVSQNPIPGHSKKGWIWKQGDMKYSLMFTAYDTKSKQTPPGLKYAIDFWFSAIKKKQ